MKRTLCFCVAAVVAATVTFATDMTLVWETFIKQPEFIVGPLDAEKAAANGFQTLDIALNSSPTVNDINGIRRLADTIDANQRLTSVSQQGVNVSIYAAPAAADGSLYKVMIIVDKAGGEDKSLFILYGTCTREGMASALSNLSIEDILPN